jgi:hypothetical protein
MIDFNDVQKPLVAVLALGAAATVGFVAGYIVGRDPETARRLAKSMANGLTRSQVAFAEAMENIGDLWAGARADARRDIENERFAAESTPASAAGDATRDADTTAVDHDLAAAQPPRRKPAARQRRTTRAPGAGKTRRKAASAVA